MLASLKPLRKVSLSNNLFWREKEKLVLAKVFEGQDCISAIFGLDTHIFPPLSLYQFFTLHARALYSHAHAHELTWSPFTHSRVLPLSLKHSLWLVFSLSHSLCLSLFLSLILLETKQSLILQNVSAFKRLAKSKIWFFEFSIFCSNAFRSI